MLRILNWFVKTFEIKLFVGDSQTTAQGNKEVTHIISWNWFPFHWVGIGGHLHLTTTSIGYTIGVGRVTYAEIDFVWRKRMTSWSWPEETLRPGLYLKRKEVIPMKHEFGPDPYPDPDPDPDGGDDDDGSGR